MKIYIEYVFVLNYLLDFMILFGTKRILKSNSSNMRIIFGSMIGSLTTFFPYLNINNNFYFILKIIISILMVLVVFGRKRFFVFYFYFYLISIFLGGFIYLFDINNSVLLLIVLFYIGIKIFIKLYSYYHNNQSNIYQVILYLSNKKYVVDAYLDTGNHLRSPISNKPIILIDFNVKYKNYYYVPYRGINGNGILPCIKPDKVFINNIEINNCLVGILKDKININGCSCILPNILKERL